MITTSILAWTIWYGIIEMCKDFNERLAGSSDKLIQERKAEVARQLECLRIGKK